MDNPYKNITSNCCSCGACMNVCPKKAIRISKDKLGFTFPFIDKQLCNRCMKCVSVCDFQKDANNGNTPKITYIAQNKNSDDLISSSSGGIFIYFAKKVTNDDGVVFATVNDKKNNVFHTSTNNIDQLKLMQGSKYVQSDIQFSYKKIRKMLEDGIYVMFVGTPCQVAGLNSYLNKDYINLLSLDIVCHGVPSLAFLKDYLKLCEQKYSIDVHDIKFRSKNIDWNHSLSNLVLNDNKFIPTNKSYYYTYFLKGKIYRESCYKCKYANEYRQGDITIGDYWGIEKVHPDINSYIDCSKGVSLLTVNTKKGEKFLNQNKDGLFLMKTDFDKAKQYNGQLCHPTLRPKDRDKIMDIYLRKGTKGLNRYFKLTNYPKLYLSRIVPPQIKKVLKKIITNFS
ncbi:MAG: Coenzyme F420 hydrogenase/dehydrogenase, beta subunit C-terminal domain [Coriobacteriia bacterium]|nr:Coenzyme F420 hydrogenase/dehydrogenase, beta subunit C-terminal domain [Coriobacteriia bacterium]